MTDEKLIEPFNLLDDSLFKSRTLILSGAVDSQLALRVNRQLLAMEQADSETPIVIMINSPGGEVYSGFSIYDTIQFIRPRVITLISGMAASMGSIVALAAEKDDRLAFPHAKLLIHQPLISGTLRGQASDIEIHARDIVDLKKRTHALYAERTGTAIEVFEELMQRDRWVDPIEAIKLGLISKIIQTRDELEEMIQAKR